MKELKERNRSFGIYRTQCIHIYMCKIVYTGILEAYSYAYTDMVFVSPSVHGSVYAPLFSFHQT